MRVGRADDVRTGGVDLRVDGEGGLVDGLRAVHDLAVVADQQQVADPDVAEVHTERVDPEVVGQLGIAGRDVAGHALVEAELAEEPEAGRQHLLAVQALFVC